MNGNKTSSCHRCGGLDLGTIFFDQRTLQSSDAGVLLLDINNISRNCRRALCKVCRFLASSTTLIDRATLADTWHLRAYNYDHLCYSPNRHAQIPTEKLVVSLVPGSVHDPSPEEIQTVSSCCILPTDRHSARQDHPAYHGRLVGRLLSFNLVRSWIDNCSQKHGQRCQQQYIKPPFDLQVIDCESGQVVKYQAGDYAALSYCIGPQTHQRENKQSLKDVRRFPKVVADAMRCCRGLGFRYLWVDQICIDQTNAVALADAISSMHQIYSASALTIVSLGPTQNHGLTGLSNNYRTKQARLRTDATTYVSTMASLSLALRMSEWATRAWCYQEAVLSGRLLFLGSGQAYFVCGTSTCQESLVEELPHARAEADDARVQIATSSLELQKAKRGHGGWSFGRWIETYTTRDLSFQADALNAFRGILNISPHYTYWGVPFVTSSIEETPSDPILAFAIGLSWATTYNQDAEIYEWFENDILTHEGYFRRSEFPSWSWASCRAFISPIAYKKPEDFSYGLESEVLMNTALPRMQIEVHNEAGTMIPIAEAVSSWPTTKVLPEKSAVIEIETNTFQFGVSRLKTRHTVLDNSGFAKFCMRIPNKSELDTSHTLVKSSEMQGGAFPEPEDGRFLIDFDRPPTVTDQYCEQVHQEEYLGLVLFYRPQDDANKEPDLGGAYCVMVCRLAETKGHHERVGLVWIEDDHLILFKLHRQKVRLK